MEECQHVKQSSMSTKRPNYYPLLYCLIFRSPPQDVPDVLQDTAPPVAFRGRAADEKKRSNMEEVHVNMNSKFNELLMMMMMMMMMMMQSKSLTFLSTVKLFVLLVFLQCPDDDATDEKRSDSYGPVVESLLQHFQRNQWCSAGSLV